MSMNDSDNFIDNWQIKLLVIYENYLIPVIGMQCNDWLSLIYSDKNDD